MKILLTNDDGIHSPGIHTLKKGLAEDFELVVSAPPDEKSASGHSISLTGVLRVQEYEEKGIPHICVYGTPVDCVKFTFSRASSFKPDLVISGINQGTNTGVSVYYSGTIAAARESVINQVPAMAVSLCSATSRDFSAALNVTRQLIEGYRCGVFHPRVMLNVNVPSLPQDQIKGMKVTHQASSRFIEEFILKRSLKGEQLFELGGRIEIDDDNGASDEEAVQDGYISVTPLRLDLTAYDAIPSLEKWLRK